MTGRLDVTGVLRRARRRADLSQREMAQVTGVSAATIGRAERTGHVTLALLERALAVAGLSLLVVDEDLRPVGPMRTDGVRDLGGRRMPAHLDPFAYYGVGLPYREGRPYPRPIGSASFARRGPVQRFVAGERPDDHPSRTDLMPRRRRGPVWVDGFDCCCGPECERLCVPECACQCEPARG